MPNVNTEFIIRKAANETEYPIIPITIMYSKGIIVMAGDGEIRRVYDKYVINSCLRSCLNNVMDGEQFRRGSSFDSTFNTMGMVVTNDIINLDYCRNSINNYFASNSLGAYSIISIEANINGIKYSTSEYKIIEMYSEKYCKNIIYSGINTYHHSHSVEGFLNEPVTPPKNYRIGCELEVIAKDFKNLDDIKSMKSNIFFCERDGSLDHSLGVEIISIPLLPEDAMSTKFWDPFVKEISSKALSSSDSRCGFHVHIGKEIFGSDEKMARVYLGKLLYFYYFIMKKTQLNTLINGRSVGYGGVSFNCPISLAAATLGPSILKDSSVHEKIIDELTRELTSHGSSNHYFDINISNEKTVEFRLGKGRINTGNIIEVITYYDLMCKYVQHKPWSRMGIEDFCKYVSAKAPKANPIHSYFYAGER